MYILLAIIAFGVLIAVHELGHFLVAKACDVKVNEFSLGMGPTLLKKQGKETLYSLRLLPIGGFCAMEGEDAETGDPRAFTAKPAWQRVLILCAGAAMNFLLGFLLVFCIAHNANFAEPIIADFMDGCPYEGTEGLMTGDRIYSIDGHRTWFTTDISEYLGRGGDTHDIVLVRDGNRVTLKNFHMPLVNYTQPDGSTLARYGLYFAPREYGLLADLKYSWYESLEFVRLVWRSLGDLVTGAVGVKDLSGAVGVVDYVNQVATEAETAEEATFDFLYIFALIAVNLAVMNMLPIPALDGGRVFFTVVTGLIGLLLHRRVSLKYEGYIHTAGFVLLMGLMVFVLFNDVIKIIAR
ncbi:MAG: site-2 protease family protein [Oscillospiraceae bacterium]|nr:site-2 protease family protein [Oscillospiraceae bacterium]